MSNSKNIALRNDNRILDAAAYHETKGMRVEIKNLDIVHVRFTEFKSLIKRGSLTLKELEDRVYGEYGVTTGEPIDNPFADMINILKEVTGKKIQDEEEPPTE